MGWLSGFPFKTQKQVEREKKDFEKRVFPLGVEEQRQAALAVLRGYMRPKLRDEEILFAFIAAKDAYLQGLEDEADPAAAALQFMDRQKRLAPGERQLILALVELEKDVTSLENYPTAKQVCAAVGVPESKET